ncbi:MAG: adenosylcobinamide-GDP ribazoletransferase [Anaerolineae bacterium]
MSFLIAWQLLTSIPLGRRDLNMQAPGRSMLWFPLVGLIIGAGLAGLDLVLTAVLPDLPATALLLAAWVASTGGLHLDGFIDCCDGLLGARSAGQRLAIMKDSRVGAFGLIGAICLLLVKFSALAALAPGARSGWLLVLPTLSRWTMVWAAWRYPLARPDGLAAWFRQGLSWPQVVVAGGTALLVALLLGGLAGLATFAAVWLSVILFVLWVQRRIPGLTGDVYGAVNELAEVLGLLMAVVLRQGMGSIL